MGQPMQRALTHTRLFKTIRQTQIQVSMCFLFPSQAVDWPLTFPPSAGDDIILCTMTPYSIFFFSIWMTSLLKHYI